MNAFPTLRLQRPRSMQAQITEQLRQQIRSGQWADGHRLPAATELAAAWQTDATTVHRALATLVKEGLLERTPRRGTFVRQRAEKLTRVAIYFMQDVGSTSDAPFLQADLRALRAVLARKGMESDVWADPRPRNQQATVWTELARAARERRVQAIILPVAHWDHIRWIANLPVPSAFAHSARLPNTVHVDIEQLVELSLKRLAQQGCRSVGAIAALAATATDPSGQPHDHYRFYERLLEVAGRLRLEIRDEWIHPVKEGALTSSQMTAFGYEEFRKLWRQPRRPAGLLVYPHSAVQGVIMGLLEAQARVPQEVRLVLHKNGGVELFCPVPATLAISDEREAAEKLVALVEKQFRGEPVEAAHWSIQLAEPAGGR